jgi:3-oxoacyl-[acyl-carrier-protein] synthase-3
MSCISIGNIIISGVSACVPEKIEEINKFPLFSNNDAVNFTKNTGVERRRIASSDVCSSDLCFLSAKKLIEELCWEKHEIDCLVFVSQTPDYILPATSVILQHRLGLSTNCYAIDISLGCSGWVYALSVISSLLSHGSMKKGLLLAGDTTSKYCSETDKSTYPLFGDAGTATALEFIDNDKQIIDFTFNSDGEGSNVIIIEDGGFRNKVNRESLLKKTISEGIERSKLDLVLEGMDVFSFGISKAPESIKNLSNYFHIDLGTIDYFIFHQANKILNETIRKKLKLEAEKVPYSLKNYGNTSCATIPLTMVTELRTNLIQKELKHICCSFGVGLSWASCFFSTSRIVCPELVVF